MHAWPRSCASWCAQAASTVLVALPAWAACVWSAVAVVMLARATAGAALAHQHTYEYVPARTHAHAAQQQQGLSTDDAGPSTSGGGGSACAPRSHHHAGGGSRGINKPQLTFSVYFPLPPFDGVHFNALKAGSHGYNFTVGEVACGSARSGDTCVPLLSCSLTRARDAGAAPRRRRPAAAAHQAGVQRARRGGQRTGQPQW